MKKALIIFLAFVMVISAGMGLAAAATGDNGDSTNGTDVQSNNSTADPSTTNDNNGKDDNKINNVTIITVVINNQEYYLINGHYYLASSGISSAAAKKAAAGGKTVPMQKTGLPILPGVLSTLMVGSGLLYGRLRN